MQQPPADLIHVVGILGSALVAAALAATHAGRPTGRRVAAAVGLFLFLSLATSTFALHRCSSGQPLQQWLVPYLGALAALLFVEPARLRRAVAAALFVVGFALSAHYNALVHGDHFTGNPAVVKQVIRPGADGATMAEERRAAPLWHTWLTGLYGVR